MKIAILSGKGGAGKTFVSVNLAACASSCVYIDCDVEEPNGHLFFHPEHCQSYPVSTALPQIDPALCNGCRTCVDFCHFNALAFIRKKPVLFPELCHSCGGCSLLCPVQAIKETRKPVGEVICGTHEHVQVVSGIMNIAEVATVSIIQKALSFSSLQELTVIDCPPGSGCPVIESIEDADYCLLVCEPTAFGFHNFRMVHELARIMNKPCGVVINKSTGNFPELIAYCSEHHLNILEDFHYDPFVAHLGAEGKIAVEQDETCHRRFCALLEKIRGEVK